MEQIIEKYHKNSVVLTQARGAKKKRKKKKFGKRKKKKDNECITDNIIGIRGVRINFILIQ